MDVFELRVVNSITGLADVVLGDVETWTVSPVMSDSGTTSFTYPLNGVNVSYLQADVEIAFFQRGVEIGTLRSVLEQIAYDEASLNEEATIGTYTCRTNMARMQRAVVYPSGWPTSNDPPNQSFTAANAGQIMTTFVTQAQARGTIPEIDISSFSGTTDSNGNAWTTTISIEWNAQTTYLQIINDLQSYGLADAEMDVHSLKLYNFQTMGVDRTTPTPPVVLRQGRDLTQSNYQASSRALATVALMSGSNNLYVESENSVAVAARGRRETGNSASGITDPTQLGIIGTQFIDALSATVQARTNAIIFGDPDTPSPVDNFDIGDWVYTDVGNGLERQRVLQWSASQANDGTVTGTTALDNIFGEFLTRLTAQVAAIENGTTITGASLPPTVPVITVSPKIPTGLAVGTAEYQDNQGHTYAYAIVAWAAVTQNSDGTPVSSLQNYLLQWKPSGATDWGQTSVSAGTTNYFIEALQPGTVYDFEVGAMNSQAGFSGWSSTVTETMAVDTTPPNEPSTPVVTSQLGQLAISWDGLDDVGVGQPIDFDHLAVYVSSSGAGFTPAASNLFATMVSHGTVTVPGASLVYGTTYFARFIAYDQSGNASVASAAGSAILTQVVSTDIATGQVGLGNLSFSDVGNLVDDGSFEDPNWRAVRNTAFGGTHFSFDNTTASNGTWSVLHTGTGGQGTETVTLTTMPANVGQTFMAAADFNTSGTVTNTMIVSVVVNFLNASMVSVGSATLTSNWTSPGTNDGAWHQRINASGGVAPAGTSHAQFQLVSTTHTTGTIHVDAVEIRLQADNLLVANAAITNAKVNDLSVNKVTAGTLSAGVIISGSIGTAASGQRCVMDGTGFHGYDSSGNMIFDVNDASPIITLGKHATGAAIQIDTSAVFPIINFFPSSGTNKAFINALTSGLGATGIGINSGSYTSPISGGATVSQRLFLEAQGSIELATINAAQNQHGGALELYDLYSTFGQYNNGTLEVGLHLDLGSTEITGTGMFNNGVGYMNATDAWNTGGESGLSGFSGASLSYGVTVTGLMLPIPGVRNPTAAASCYLSGSSTTGFNIGWTTATVTHCSWWATRM